MTLEELEKEYLISVLEESNWQKKRASSILGINASTLYRKIQRYGLDRDKDKVLAGLASEVEQFAAWLFPSAIVTRNQILVGDVHGSPGTSLKIETKGAKRGLWKDFADPSQKGGDLIGLYMATKGVTFPQAIDDLSDWVGKGQRPEVNYQRAQLVRKLKKVDRDLGPPVGSWHYTDAEGVIVATVYRFEPEPGSKEFLPWDAVKRRYGNPDIRPLYNIPGVLRSPSIVFV
jgi:putative DNA primase/helicase